MDTASCLASNVQTRNCPAIPDALALHGCLQTSHAVVDHGCDDRSVEGLSRHLGSIDDVVIELLAAAGFSRWLVPGLAGRVRRITAALRVLLCILGCLVMLL